MNDPNPLRKRLRLAVCLLPLAICAAAPGCGQQVPARRPLADPAATSARSESEPAGRRVYEIDYHTVSRADARALLDPGDEPDGAAASGLASTHEARVRGQLIVTRLGEIEDGSLLAWRLADGDVELKINQQAMTARAEAIRGDLARAWFTEMGPQGRVQRVWFDDVDLEISMSVARALTAAAQFVLPADGALSEAWQTREDDPNGTYVARYEPLAPREKVPGLRFKKTVLRYLPENRPRRSGQLAVNKSVRSTGDLDACWDAGLGCLRSLGGTQTQHVQVQGKTIARAENALQLTLLRHETPPAAEREALLQTCRNGQSGAVPLSAAPGAAVRRRHASQQQLGDATAEQLLQQAQRLDSDPEGMRETPLYLKLKALLELHPEESQRLGQRAAAADAGSRSRRLLTAVLGAVGHADAQRAMVEIIRQRPDERALVLRLVAMLGDVPEPTPATRAALESLAFESGDQRVAAAAQLALGNLAREPDGPAAARDTERGASITRLLDQLNAAQSDADVQRGLLALGNTGSSRALRDIVQRLDHREPRVRAAAAYALRWIDDPAADDRLADVLTSDRDRNVRHRAAAALRWRTPVRVTFEALKSALETDPDDRVRLAALAALWAGQHGQARALVVAARDGNSAPSVRQAAARLLSAD